MCPACLANAAMVIGSVFSTGGVTAIVAKAVIGRGRSKSGRTDPVRPSEEYQLPQIQKEKAKENRS